MNKEPLKVLKDRLYLLEQGGNAGNCTLYKVLMETTKQSIREIKEPKTGENHNANKT